MRKVQFPLIFMLIAALILSACATTPGAQATPGIDVTAAIPETGATEVATEPADEAATLVVTEEADVIPTDTAATPEMTEAATLPATEMATETATETATEMATDAAGTPEAAETPEAGATTPQAQAPAQTGQFVRLSQMLEANVNSQDATQVGQVDAVLVERPVLPEVIVEEAAEGETTTPAPSPTPLSPEDNRVFVRYVVVNVSGTEGEASSEGNEVIVPWQAFAFDGAAADTLTLNVDSDAFTNAPRTQLVDIASGSATFATEVAQYWGAEGVAIPATGAEAADTENLVLIPDEGGVIGVTDAAEEAIGDFADMLIDPTSGEVLYVVFTGGEMLGNRTFAVPVRTLTWATGEAGALITNRGNFRFNFPTEMLNDAPSLESLEGLELNEEWSEELNNFWEQIQGGGSQ